MKLFLPRIFLALGLFGLGLAPLGAATLDLGAASAFTPYDRYMNTVKSVLSRLGSDAPDLNQVRELMREGRSFRYTYENPYLANPPEVTETRKAGDCKDKALWLASRLNDPNLRYVIGKANLNSEISHAWLYWKDSTNQWWILDCTNKKEPVPVARIPSNEYVPLFSYSKSGAFRHNSSLQNGARAVAAVSADR